MKKERNNKEKNLNFWNISKVEISEVGGMLVENSKFTD